MKTVKYYLLIGFLTLLGINNILPVMADSGVFANASGWGSQDTTYKIGAAGVGDGSLQEDKLITSAKNFINWMLGMLATIALVICLYAGFLMVTSAGDEKKYSKGMDILKKAGIGLVIIGLAWLIVSVVFWLIKNLVA